MSDGGGQDTDALHDADRADRTDAERAAGEGLVTVVRVGQRGQHRRRWWRGVEELAAAGQLARACAVAEQSVVADALEAVRHDMEQEASDELVSAEGHDFVAVVVAIVLPAEGDGAVLDPGQPGVGDGNAMSVAAEIGEHVLRSTERRLGVDHPVDAARRAKQPGKAIGLVEVGEGAAEGQFASLEGLIESLKEQAAEQARQHADRQEEAGAAGHPALTVGGQAATGNDAVQVWVYAVRTVMPSRPKTERIDR